MKKILSLILVLAMTFSLSTTALAADSTTSSISENEAVELARWFGINQNIVFDYLFISSHKPV